MEPPGRVDCSTNDSCTGVAVLSAALLVLVSSPLPTPAIAVPQPPRISAGRGDNAPIGERVAARAVVVFFAFLDTRALLPGQLVKRGAHFRFHVQPIVPKSLCDFFSGGHGVAIRG